MSSTTDLLREKYGLSSRRNPLATPTLDITPRKTTASEPGIKPTKIADEIIPRSSPRPTTISSDVFIHRVVDLVSLAKDLDIDIVEDQNWLSELLNHSETPGSAILGIYQPRTTKTKMYLGYAVATEIDRSLVVTKLHTVDPASVQLFSLFAALLEVKVTEYGLKRLVFDGDMELARMAMAIGGECVRVVVEKIVSK